MTNKVFEVSVRSHNLVWVKSKDTHRIYGMDNALQYGMEIGVCDNVETVDVVDASTGEVILTMENGEVTYRAGEDEPVTAI